MIALASACLFVGYVLIFAAVKGKDAERAMKDDGLSEEEAKFNEQLVKNPLLAAWQRKEGGG
jgi:hypothetical protein